MDKFITAKEIAAQYRLSYQVINRYTNAGLLNVVFKKGNVRIYRRQEVEKRLKQIDAFVREGYPFALMRKKLVGI